MKLNALEICCILLASTVAVAGFVAAANRCDFCHLNLLATGLLMADLTSCVTPSARETARLTVDLLENLLRR